MRSYWVLSYTNTLAPKAGGTPTDDKGKCASLSPDATRTPPGESLVIFGTATTRSPRRGVEYCESDSRPTK